MILETKGCSLELKDLSTSKREVAFYFSNFGTVDNHKDIVQKGAFTKSAQEGLARVKHFKNHIDTENFGRILSIEEDAKGAFAVSRVKRGPAGDQMITDYEDGIITEHSFGAYPVKQAKGENGVTIKQEYKLMEVSSLDAWGANENTPLISLKSLSKGLVDLDLFLSMVKNTELSSNEYKDLKAKFTDILSHINSLPDNEPDNTATPIVRAEDVKSLITEIKSYQFV